MVSDLSEYHHIDLTSAIRDSTPSPRMLLARLAELPEDSATKASLRGVPRGWDTENDQLAALIDAIQDNTWVTRRVAGDKKARRPKRVWRPKQKKQSRVVTVAQMNEIRGV